MKWRSTVNFDLICAQRCGQEEMWGQLLLGCIELDEREAQREAKRQVIRAKRAALYLRMRRLEDHVDPVGGDGAGADDCGRDKDEMKMVAELALQVSDKVRQCEPRDVVDMKIKKDEVMMTGAKTEMTCEMMTATEMGMIELAVVMQLVEVDGVVARGEFGGSTGFDGSRIPVGGFDGVREWEMMQKWFQLAQNVAVDAAQDDTEWTAEMRVVVAMEEVVRKAERQIVQVAVLQEEDADQKAAEMDLGTTGMAVGTAAITVVGMRKIGRFGESGDQYGKIGRLPDAEEDAEGVAEVAKDAEGQVVGTAEEVAATA